MLQINIVFNVLGRCSFCVVSFYTLFFISLGWGSGVGRGPNVVLLEPKKTIVNDHVFNGDVQCLRVLSVFGWLD